MLSKAIKPWLEWLWLLPFAAALYYPWALAWSNQAHVAGAGTPVVLALILSAYAVPLLAFACVYATGVQPVMSARLVLARRLSCLAVAAPPAYTLMGVLLYLMKIEGHDIAVWSGLWLALAGFFAMVSSTGPSISLVTLDKTYIKLRVAHGIASVAILLVFLAPHLFNHLLGVLGTDVHKSVMDVLRRVYRNGWLEPVIIVTFFLQIRERAGYMAQMEPLDEGWLLVENHCPICVAARKCQGFCRSELQIFQAALGDENVVERREHLISGDRRCAYSIQPRRL